jgi:predicted Zn-dependent peptidase
VGDTTSSYINWYFGCYANGEMTEPAEDAERISNVTRERIIEAAKSFELDTVYVMRGE